MLTGLNRNLENGQGALLGGTEHIAQSIRDILTTPLGTRIMRPDYGSRIFELLDNPVNEEFFADLFAATFEAIDKWEPRVRALRIKVSDIDHQHVALDLTVYYAAEEREITVAIELPRKTLDV